jgi:hypothetical protein
MPAFTGCRGCGNERPASDGVRVLVIAPAVCAVSTQLGQILPYAECGGPRRLSAIAASLCLIAAAVSGWLSWRAASRIATGDGAFQFVARLSGALGAVFAFALVLQAMAGIVLTGCER